MKLSLRITLLTCMALFTGCASTYQSQISNQDRLSLSQLNVVSHFTQEEIGSRYAASNMTSSMQGGALFMLIDSAVNSHRAKKSEAAAEIYRDALLGYDIVGMFGQEIRASLTELPWTNLGKFESITDTETIDVPMRLAEAQGSAILVLRPTYFFSPQADAIYLDMTASLYRKNDAKQKAPLFSNVYSYQSPIRRPDSPFLSPSEAESEIAAITTKYQTKIDAAQRNESRRQYYKKIMGKQIQRVKKRRIDSEELATISKEAWNPDNLKATLQTGAKQIANLLLLDLNDKLSEAEYQSIERKVNVNFIANREDTTDIDVYPMGNFDGYSIYRQKSGKLFSVPTNQNIRFYYYPK